MKIEFGIMFSYFQLLKRYTHLAFDDNGKFNVGEMYMIYDKECYMWKPVIIIDNINDLYEVEFVIGHRRMKNLRPSQIGIPIFGNRF